TFFYYATSDVTFSNRFAQFWQSNGFRHYVRFPLYSSSYAHTFGVVCAGGRNHHGGLGVQRESVEHHCCFTQRFVLSWVSMDEVGDILWISFPVDDQLCFTNLF